MSEVISNTARRNDVQIESMVAEQLGEISWF